MTATMAFPRTQHWTAEGFRVSILVYKSHLRTRCHACGEPGAIHFVSADGRGALERFSALADYCDDCRPPRGTLPDLDYARHHWHAVAGIVEREHLLPVAGICDVCGCPAIAALERRCRDCDDPARWRVETSRIITLRGERTETRRVHDDHVTDSWIRCREHRDLLLTEAVTTGNTTSHEGTGNDY